MSRQDQARITVSVDGVALGVFETRSGGETDSSESQYRLGGMGPRISLGGNVMVGNVTVKRLYDTDAQSRAKWLQGRVGRGRMVVTEQSLDVDGNSTGDPLVWSGVLKRVTTPDRDAESDTAATIELEMSTSGRIA